MKFKVNEQSIRFLTLQNSIELDLTYLNLTELHITQYNLIKLLQ